MSRYLKLASALIVILAVYWSIFRTGQKLEELEEKWWGDSGAKSTENHEITKTRIDVPSEVLRDLQQRLENTRPFHPSHTGVAQHYGITTTVLNSVLDHWRTKYNWTERQNYLNRYPQYFVQIRGLRIHFVHIKPQIQQGTKKILPLMLLHGWPSSFSEFYEVVPYLVTPQKDRDYVFELVIPSLPGFAFSQSSRKPGLSPVYIAQIFKDLMEVLGYQRYYVHGGDWGSPIAQHMAHRFQDRVIGLHSTMCFINSPRAMFMFFIGKYLPSLVYDIEEVKLCNSTANSLSFILSETGYFHLQATKPDTVGVALRDSPMGLAAYMLEKFSTLTNAAYRDRDDGGLTEKFTWDRLLDNIMIYWVTQSMTSAMRIYSEVFTNRNLELGSFNSMKIDVPTGCARFPYELVVSPRSILKERFHNLIHLTSFSTGGHFSALEEPKLLADDIYSFVNKVQQQENTD